MAFKTIEKIKTGGTPLVGITVGLQKVGHARHDVAVFSFGHALVEELGWAAANKITVALGDGIDAGVVCLSNGALSGFVLQLGNRGGGKSFALLVRALASSMPAKRTYCQHKIKDGALYITLPEKGE